MLDLLIYALVAAYGLIATIAVTFWFLLSVAHRQTRNAAALLN